MFEVLKKFYAKPTLQSCNKLMNSRCKVIKINLLNDFLLQCLNKFVCPEWLISRIYKSKIKHSQKAEVIFIKSEISKNNHYLSNLRLVIDMCSIKLKNELREDHSRKFNMYIRNKIKSFKFLVMFFFKSADMVQ